MTTPQIHLDLLAQVDAQSDVTFWRPLAFGEPSNTPTEKFGTGTQWVKISGSSFTGLLGSEDRPVSVEVSLTVFSSVSFDVLDVAGISPSGSWRLNGSDSDPTSPTYDSPAATFDNNLDATVSFELQLRTGNHSLSLALSSVQYDPSDVSAGNTPPEPIIIADVPKPDPNPVAPNFPPPGGGNINAPQPPA